VAGGARLFDLDGTLWDGYAFYSEVLGATRTTTSAVAREALLAGANIVHLLHQHHVTRAQATRALQAGPGVRSYSNVREVLVELDARHHPLGIVTSLPGWLANAATDALQIRSLFRVIIHRGNCRAAKPSPIPIRMALESLGRGSGSTSDVYVGDSPVDSMAAQRVGIRFAWASWGYGVPEGSYQVLRSPLEILNL